MTSSVAKNVRLTGTARREFAASLRGKYENGTSIRALAEATGRSYGSVHRMLIEAGTRLRGRGGDNTGGNTP